MLAVVQRVSEARVEVAECGHDEAIGPGMCVLLGVEGHDGISQAEWMAKKLANLRIFRDADGLMNRSLLDIGGEAMVVSQFTLAGDCRKGNRPSFVRAAPPETAMPLYEQVVGLLRGRYRLTVRTGIFGGVMRLSLVNDGPVTIILSTPSE